MKTHGRLELLFVIAIALTVTTFVHADAKGRSGKVLFLKAPEALAKLWTKWNGKYVLFAHKAAGIEKFNDLKGRMLVCAAINIKVETILDAASAFNDASNLTLKIGLQNHADLYEKQFMEKANDVAFLTPEIAKHYGFSSNDKLIELRIK